MNKKIKVILSVIILIVVIVVIIFNRVKPEKVVVEGHNLEQINFKIDINNDEKFVDPNNSYSPEYSIYHLTEKMNWLTVDPPYTIKNFTIIAIDYSDTDIDTTILPIMYLQCFYKKDLSQRNFYVKIEEKYYNKKQLKDYIVYEDEEIIVYNINSLMNIYDIDTKISKLSDENNENTYDYTWLKEMHDYFMHNELYKIHK